MTLRFAPNSKALLRGMQWAAFFCLPLLLLAQAGAPAEKAKDDPKAGAKARAENGQEAGGEVDSGEAKQKSVPLEDRLWTHAHPWNLLKDGSFEQWDGEGKFPPEWKAWSRTSTVEIIEEDVKFNGCALRLTGQQNGYCVFAIRDLPEPYEIVGQEVVFSVWVRTYTPQFVEVAIYDSYEYPHTAQAQTWGEWVLLVVRTTIMEDADLFEVGIGLMPNDDPVVCDVDGAALYISRPIPAPPEDLK